MPIGDMTEQRHQSPVYRLIGIRSDDSREVIGEGLTREQASELFMTLMDSKEFPALTLERDLG